MQNRDTQPEAAESIGSRRKTRSLSLPRWLPSASTSRRAECISLRYPSGSARPGGGAVHRLQTREWRAGRLTANSTPRRRASFAPLLGGVTHNLQLIGRLARQL